MDTVDMVVKDIIELKYESCNIQHDATVENMYEWYSWAYIAGLVEVIYKYGELQGFMEWVRLPSVPETRDEIVNMVDYDDFNGPVLYIANACTRDDKRHGTFWRLSHIVKEKNKDAEFLCYHEDDDTMKLYKNNEYSNNKEGVLI